MRARDCSVETSAMFGSILASRSTSASRARAESPRTRIVNDVLAASTSIGT